MESYSKSNEYSPCRPASEIQDQEMIRKTSIEYIDFATLEGFSKSIETSGNQLELLIANKKLVEAAEFIMDDRNYQEVRTHSFHTLVDKLCESAQVNTFSNLLIWLVRKQSELLTKYTMKRYFALLLKQSKMSIGHIILEEFLEQEAFKSLLVRVYQYYISGLIKCLEMNQAFKVFENMKNNCPVLEEENLTVYFKIYESLIKGCFECSNQGFLEEAKVLVEEVARHHPNDVYFNKLIDFAAKHKDLNFAEFIFKVMVANSIQPSIVTYNTLIDSYFRQNKYNQAWILFDLLKKSDKKPDNFTYTTMINGIKSMENPDLNRAFQLFNEYREISQPDQIIYNCLMDACINARNIEKAQEVLIQMKSDPTVYLDEITFNTLIKGCCRSKKLAQAVMFFQEMKQMGVKPNRITYNSLIDTCVKCNRMFEAWQYYDEMVRNEIHPDNFTYSILINGIKSNHGNKEELNKALGMLEKLQLSPDFKPDEIFYNSLIDTCIKFNEINKGLSLFEEMKKKNIEPSGITFGILIKAFGKMNDLVKAFKIFEQMKLKNMRISDVTYGCLLDACVKNERMDLALILVDKMKQDNVTLNTILYTTLIKGFAKVNKLEEAANIFALMKESSKTYPNLVTHNCMLDACIRCDSMPKAIEIFETMQRERMFIPDLITYAIMIKGFCKQKNVERATQFLHMMLNSHIRPDEGLINLLLESCYITGKLDKGNEIFNIMNSLKIPASNITYSMLIKLYGKVRKIHKAVGVLDIMKQNRVKPNLITYTNLVQACLKAKHLDYLKAILSDLQNDNLKVDQVFYSKLISGLENLGNRDMLCFYLKKSLNDKIILGQDLYDNALRLFETYEGPEKDEVIQRIQNLHFYKNKNTFKENIPQHNFDTNSKRFENRRFNDDKENQDNNTWKNSSKPFYKNHHVDVEVSTEKKLNNNWKNSKNAAGGFNKKPFWNNQSQNQNQNQTQGEGVFSNALKNRFR